MSHMARDIRETLMSSDSEFRKLATEHSQYEAQLGKDDHAALLKVTHSATTDVRLRDLVHEDGRHYAALHPSLLECILQGNGVDDRGKHAHVVGGHAVHFLGLLGDAAKEVAAADYDADLHTQRVNFGEFAGNLGNLFSVQAKPARASQGLS